MKVHIDSNTIIWLLLCQHSCLCNHWMFCCAMREAVYKSISDWGCLTFAHLSLVEESWAGQHLIVNPLCLWQRPTGQFWTRSCASPRCLWQKAPSPCWSTTLACWTLMWSAATSDRTWNEQRKDCAEKTCLSMCDESMCLRTPSGSCSDVHLKTGNRGSTSSLKVSCEELWFFLSGHLLKLEAAFDKKTVNLQLFKVLFYSFLLSAYMKFFYRYLIGCCISTFLSVRLCYF